MSSRSFSHHSKQQQQPSSSGGAGSGSGRGFTKTQKRFVPKTANTTNSAAVQPQSRSSNPPTTLSSSLRQSNADSPAASSVAGSSGGVSRVRLVGDSGLVPNRAQDGGNFVNYLPQDEAVASGLGADEGGLDPIESQRVVDLLNRELSRLLKLNPRDFWREVATDVSFHDFLDSYLQFRSRWYDFSYHGAKGTVAGVIVGDFELSRRVFMVLYRISSNRDPSASAVDSLSSKDHGILLQEKKLLDLPKMLDICAIYGHENEDLTRSLVTNALKAQPNLHKNIISMMSHFLGVVHTMYQRCSSSLEAVISTNGHEEMRDSRRHAEYLEVLDFLNDGIVSVDAFLDAYKPAAVFYACPVEMSHGNEELVNILARLHDSLLPALQQGLQIILGTALGALPKSSLPMLSDISICLKSLSSRIVDLGWKLLYYCFLSDEVFKDELPLPAARKMFPADVEDPVIRGDILVQTFKEIAGVAQPAHGLKGTFLQNIDKSYQVMQKVEHLQNKGWIFIDDDQYQYLAGLMMHHMVPISKESTGAPASVKGDDLQKDEDAAISESKISQIRDLFPDFGKGFLTACLEAYNQNPEEVIQRILEGTLHEDLQSMDTSLEKLPPKPSPSVSKDDKGKGKLVESPPFSSSNIISEDSKQRPQPLSSSSSSSVGRFVRKSNAIEPDHWTLDSRVEKPVEKTAALLSLYEYEDEYDDSYDDLGMSIVESGFEETETLRDRIGSNKEMSSGAERDVSASNAPRWNSRKKPQFFVKDGKNYSYKVEGSVAVANYNEASIVNQAQKELIHGLGCGGNLPLGAVKKLEESNEDDGDQTDPSEGDGRGKAGGSRGRGRGGWRGGRNHYQRDRAMKKHMAGLGGF